MKGKTLRELYGKAGGTVLLFVSQLEAIKGSKHEGSSGAPHGVHVGKIPQAPPSLHVLLGPFYLRPRCTTQLLVKRAQLGSELAELLHACLEGWAQPFPFASPSPVPLLLRGEGADGSGCV